MHTKTIEIAKSERGWLVHTTQHWADFPAAHTSKGATTLAQAIWGPVYHASQNDTRIVKLTVNGLPYPRDKAEAAIRKYTTGTLNYTLEASLAALDI